jgi:acetylornithine/N-succinyldiaminopimelate aminotransferase
MEVVADERLDPEKVRVGATCTYLAAKIFNLLEARSMFKLCSGKKFKVQNRLVSFARHRLLSASPRSESAEELEKTYLLGNYGSDGIRLMKGLVIERGQGSTLFSTDGRSFLDFFGGIAVNALGHSDPKVAAVISEQALKIQHTSNILHTMEPLRLAKLMVEKSVHFDKVFFANSGTEANEGALKFARKAALLKSMQKDAGLKVGTLEQKPAPYTAFGCKQEHPTACYTRGGICGCWPQSNNNNVAMGVKNEVIAFKGSFHGRTMGALAATHKPSIRMPFAPFPSDVRFARFNNLDDVHKHWNEKIGAVIVEPTQGEGGIFPADAGFMKGIRQLCDEHDVYMIVDEVQCGLGRTGRLWAHEAYDVAPDMMTLAKPLAGGLPIGAIMMTNTVAAAISPGDHGTTFGGNPFITRVAEHVFTRIADPNFLAHVQARGKQLVEGCKKLLQKYPQLVKEVRSPLDNGLFVGVDLIVPFKYVQAAAAERGLLLISAGENTIRLAPPLVITEEEVSFGLRVLDEALDKSKSNI